MQQRKRHLLVATAASFGGTALIFTLVLGINEFADRGPEERERPATQFQVERPEPPPQPEPEPEREPEPDTSPAEPPPPMADLASGIGNVDIPIPGLDTRELDQLGSGEGGDDDLVMTDESVDNPPRPVRQPAMEYPSDAKRRGVEGYVVLSVLIDRDGQIEQVKVLESEPAGVFDEAARESVRQWRFRPAEYQGREVKVWARQKVRFQLG